MNEEQLKSFLVYKLEGYDKNKGLEQVERLINIKKGLREDLAAIYPSVYPFDKNDYVFGKEYEFEKEEKGEEKVERDLPLIGKALYYPRLGRIVYKTYEYEFIGDSKCPYYECKVKVHRMSLKAYQIVLDGMIVQITNAYAKMPFGQ